VSGAHDADEAFKLEGIKTNQGKDVDVNVCMSPFQRDAGARSRQPTNSGRLPLSIEPANGTPCCTSFRCPPTPTKFRQAPTGFTKSSITATA
jgi:hypothetical protein